MGWFDRFRSSGNNAQELVRQQRDSSDQSALRLIDEGNSLEESGQWQQAMDCYERAVQLAPHLPRAHLNHGNILVTTGRMEEALAAYDKAINLDPNYAGAFFNKGNAYMAMSRQEEAQTAYKKALQINPDFADAHVRLGCLLEEMDQPDDAIESYRRALAINPDYAEVYYNLGNTLRRLERIEEASDSYRRAIDINPKLVDALINLGDLERVQRNFDSAIACFHKALELTPSNEKAHFCLGVTYKEKGQLEDAIASFRQTLTINPDNTDAHIFLGDTSRDLGLHDQALASYERAVKIAPEHAVARNNLGNAFLDRGRLLDAISCYRQAVELQPDFAAGLSNLGSVLKDIGRPIEALDSIRRALDILPGLTAARSNLLFIHNSLENLSGSELLAEAKRYGDIVAAKARPFTAWQCTPRPDRCLRIGFVSGDFRDHPVGHFVEGVFRSLSTQAKGRLEIHAYYAHHQTDDVGERIKSSCHAWHPVANLLDSELAERIHDDGIDILIDLSGHTSHNCLPVFAWKPAPVQATWLGYLGTTGVAAIDYLIADAWTLPETEAAHFSEKIWRLPESYLCFTPPTAKTAVNALPAIDNGYVTFGCFNNLNKVTDEVVALWARLLSEIPDSRLFLKTKQLAESSVQQSVRERFAVHGISPERLILSAQVPRGEYLVPYQQIDIALDPFPYTGITTTVETLWMGVPVVSLAGSSFLSRQGVGLLTNAGLSDWIATDPDDYIARAKAHTSDLGKLAQLRAGLRQQIMASPIFNTQRFAQHFEKMLREMWKQWCPTEGHSAYKHSLPSQMTTFSLSPNSWETIGFPNTAHNVQKPAAKLREALTPNGELKLHIGGRQPKDGWKILNSQAFEGVDYIGDVRDLSAFPDGCCDKIYASHVMEHVSQKDFLCTLKGIHRILRIGGEFYFSVPDLEVLCRLFVDPKLDGAQRFHVMRMMFGGQQDDFDFHFIGLTAEFMNDYFKQAGFSNTKRVESLGIFNDTSNYKPYGTPISLNMIATK